MILVRSPVTTDVEAVVALEQAVFGRGAWSPASVGHELAGTGEGRHVLVAVDGSEIVGYGALSSAGETSDLRRLAVMESHRRHRVATLLLEELLALARRLGCDRTLLEVAADNRAALALYERNDLREIARRPRYYPRAAGAAVDAVVMEVRLAGRASSHVGADRGSR